MILNLRFLIAMLLTAIAGSNALAANVDVLVKVEDEDTGNSLGYVELWLGSAKKGGIYVGPSVEGIPVKIPIEVDDKSWEAKIYDLPARAVAVFAKSKDYQPGYGEAAWEINQSSVDLTIELKLKRHTSFYPTTTTQPVTTYYPTTTISQPVTTYYPTTTISQPVTTYYPTTTISQPVTSYYPTTTISQPVTSYYPTTTISSPITSYFPGTMISRPLTSYYPTGAPPVVQSFWRPISNYP